MKPIYTSHLDNDTYKFHMGAFFWHHHREVETTYAYKCRDPQINLRCIEDELKEQIIAMHDVGLTGEEKVWLFKNTNVTYDYLNNFLADFRFNPDQVEIERIDENPGLSIRITGEVVRASLWEIPLMYIISELYFNKKYGDVKEIAFKAMDDLNKKIFFVKERRPFDFKFSEFGTRRRLCKLFQEMAIDKLRLELPHNLIGTSNMLWAKNFNIPAVGTQAHEAFMLYQGLVHPEDSQTKFLKDWIEFYGGRLGIALTDTLGSNKWIRDFNKGLMKMYSGQRHDSGDPVDWANDAIFGYEQNGINPNEKTLFFSDNLTFESAMELTRKFGDWTNVVHGIGTHITNHIPSMPEHKALNQVIKLVRSNGRPVAKLSADPMKAQCEDEVYLNYIKHISKA